MICRVYSEYITVEGDLLCRWDSSNDSEFDGNFD